MASAAEQLAKNLNFSTFSKAKVLQQRLWFTLGALLVYRLGTYIPVPGIDPDAYAQTFKQAQTGIFGMFDLFSGGAVHRMAIFALNLIPYITASIVVQLATSLSPTLAAIKKEGESGRKRLNQYTRYGTVALTAVQGWFIAVGLEAYGANAGALRYFHHDASRLTSTEAARIAAVLPLPKRRDAVDPAGFTRRYGNLILRRIGTVRAGALDACVYR